MANLLTYYDEPAEEPAMLPTCSHIAILLVMRLCPCCVICHIHMLVSVTRGGAIWTPKYYYPFPPQEVFLEDGSGPKRPVHSRKATAFVPKRTAASVGS